MPCRQIAAHFGLYAHLSRPNSLERFLSPMPSSIRVITRFSLDDFASGVSDIDSLRYLIGVGGQVRGIRGLHAKLYLFGESRAVITSANLTSGGLLKNHEFGIVAEDQAAVKICLAYFEELWKLGKPLQPDQVDEWEKAIRSPRPLIAEPWSAGKLPDYGADAGFSPSPHPEDALIYADPPQAIVKFLGGSRSRMSPEKKTLVEIERSNCHRVLAYPDNRRPRSVKEGAIMFIARFTSKPGDIRIFGRAIARKYVVDPEKSVSGGRKRQRWDTARLGGRHFPSRRRSRALWASQNVANAATKAQHPAPQAHQHPAPKKPQRTEDPPPVVTSTAPQYLPPVARHPLEPVPPDGHPTSGDRSPVRWLADAGGTSSAAGSRCPAAARIGIRRLLPRHDPGRRGRRTPSSIDRPVRCRTGSNADFRGGPSSGFSAKAIPPRRQWLRWVVAMRTWTPNSYRW